MKADEFHEFLNQAKPTGPERAVAWNCYKAQGPEAAILFVQNLPERQKALLESPVPYKIWGEQYIDENAKAQMDKAACLPIALAGALMPDAHSGYGLPIGGVLATDNAVIPYAVGVDIACRMMLTVYATSPDVLKDRSSPSYKHLYAAILNHTFFGPGSMNDGDVDHPILDASRWELSGLTRSLRQTAVHQLGTSGGGNHFVEWGDLEVTNPNNPFHLPVGHYLALLSHSGSRGVGYKIANHYTKLATDQMPQLDQAVKHLAWLPLDQDVGREYWDAMQLAGDFASANHHIIHASVSRAVGISPIATVENHHNFAWKETVIVEGKEKEAIVHRKGATPAGSGVLGIIPGTMADPGYLVSGKGNAQALNSASHGSGRQMGRMQAKRSITQEQQRAYLSQRGIDLIGGGIDESPQAYKAIDAVMEAQKDLVDILGKFQPKIVRMASDRGERSRKLPEGVIEGE